MKRIADGPHTPIKRGMPWDMSIAQARIDYHGQGIFAVEGSEARYLLSSAYAKLRSSVILE